LRLTHDGFAALRIEDDNGRMLFVDPHEPSDFDYVALTGGPWAERFAGVGQHTESHGHASLLGPEETVGWVRQRPQLQPAAYPGQLGDFGIQALPYTPLESTHANVDKLRAALRNPVWASQRVVSKRGLPFCEPVALRIDVPQDHAIALLGLALHSHTPSRWIARARQLLEGVELVLASFPTGEEEAFIEHIVALSPPRLLLMDQTNDLRRAAGLPAQLLTPIRDRLMQQDIDTHVFVAATSYRFEPDDTVKRW